MDKTIEQIFKAFSHIAREVQIYLISGFLVILNILACEYLNDNLCIFYNVFQKQFIIPLIIIAYVIGHICVAVFYAIRYIISKCGKIEEDLKDCIEFKHEANLTILPSLYKKDPKTYTHFIERYDLLNSMRRTMSAAFFINFLVDIIYCITDCECQIQICSLGGVSFLAFACLFILTYRTEKGLADRIDRVNELNITKLW